MHMDTREKHKLFFYLDIVILGVGAVALVSLVHDAFSAGYAAEANAAAYTGYMWRMVAEGLALGLAMVYFLTRFFKVRVRELSNPWG